MVGCIPCMWSISVKSTFTLYTRPHVTGENVESCPKYYVDKNDKCCSKLHNVAQSCIKLFKVAQSCTKLHTKLRKVAQKCRTLPQSRTKMTIVAQSCASTLGYFVQGYMQQFPPILSTLDNFRHFPLWHGAFSNIFFFSFFKMNQDID